MRSTSSNIVLVQEAAYGTLLRPDRQGLHAHVVGVIEERFQEMVETEPKFLAHHCEHAGLIGKAVEYRRKAGLRAVDRSAAVEAVTQLQKGRELLARLPAGPERDRQEISLQVALAGVLVGTRGYSAPEMGQALARARELCERTGDRSRLFPVLNQQRTYHYLRAELDRARELGEEMLHFGGQWRDKTVQIAGHIHFCQVAYSRGEFNLAREHVEKALALYDPEEHYHLTFLYGQHPRVNVLSWLSWILLPLGYPQQALHKGTEALAHARELAHVNSVALARHFSSWLYQLLSDRPAALQESEAQLSFCTQHGLFFWLAGAHCLHGWAVAVTGKPEAGIAELTQGIASYRATGAELFVPFHLGLHAAALRETGQPAEPSLALLSDALARVDRTGERNFEAEFHRMRGECLLALPAPEHAAAEASFIRALEIARGQSARMWELRAAVSLARLWHGQRKSVEARGLLAPIYGWFTEGFETSDLRNASMMLDTLRK